MMKLTGTDGQTNRQDHVLSKADALTKNTLGKLLDKLEKKKESKAIKTKFVCTLLWNNDLIFYKYLCTVTYLLVHYQISHEMLLHILSIK